MNKTERMTINQKIRAEMRKHGLTEIFEGIYSAGDVKDGKMAVVHLQPLSNYSDENVEVSCRVAAETYRNTVKPDES